MTPLHVLLLLVAVPSFQRGEARSPHVKVAERAPPGVIEPWFAEPIPNVTVAEGRAATLPCVVEYLGNYRLAWIHKERHMLLTMHDHVITLNPRVSIRHDRNRTWWLRLDNVRPEDSGTYMCQLNTAPMKSIDGLLQVVVAPSIDEETTSSDLQVREGTDVDLHCHASGSPKPDIHWRREADKDIILSPTKRVSSVQGQVLKLSKTNRLSMGAYLCIASNGVQPSVSKRIMLNVLFAPMVLIPSQLIGAHLGEDVTLVCNLESHPRSVTYWTLTGGILLVSNSKYRVHQEPNLGSPHKIRLELFIRDLKSHDFGDYTCVAKNPLGETEGTITLYEKPSPVTPKREEQEHIEHHRQLKRPTEPEFLPEPDNIKQDWGAKSDQGATERQLVSAGISQNTRVKEISIEERYVPSPAIVHPTKKLVLFLCCAFHLLSLCLLSNAVPETPK